jgi:hypothetical protein
VKKSKKKKKKDTKDEEAAVTSSGAEASPVGAGPVRAALVAIQRMKAELADVERLLTASTSESAAPGGSASGSDKERAKAKNAKKGKKSGK